MRSLVIIGAGGHGRELLDIIEAINEVAPAFDMKGFLAAEADSALLGKRGMQHLGDVDAWSEIGADCFALGIGMPWTRRDVAAMLPPDATPAPPIVHPTATIGAANELGAGVVLAAGARVTTNVRLGMHTHLNVNAVVSHDVTAGAYVTLSPGALVNGDVTLGDGVFVGTGAVVVRGVTVGDDAKIGAGAVVVEDVPAGVTAKGVPARW